MKHIETLLTELNKQDIHLTVEGENLQINAPKGALTSEWRAELITCKTEIIHYLQQQAVITQPIPTLPRTTFLPLSFAQQRLWFLHQLEGPSATYNIPMGLQLFGHLDYLALQQSLQTIIQRHEVLRTSFAMHNGTPVAQLAEIHYQLPLIHLTTLATEEKLPHVKQLLNEEARRPFDLTQAPLMRTTLIQLDSEWHILLFNMHHIISDGWSIGVLIQELSAGYQTFSQDKSFPLPPLPIQYADFAHWQQQLLTSDLISQQKNYWKKQLNAAPIRLELPTDYPRPPIQRFQGKSEYFQIDNHLTQQLNALSQRTETTLFMVLLATFATLLARYSGQTDIIIGSPIANRTHEQVEPLLGFFVNNLVLRLNLAGNPHFHQFIQHVKQVTLAAYANQDVPFEQLVDELRIARNLSHTPLFQVLFVLQNTPFNTLNLPGLTIELLVPQNTIAKFDLTLNLEETPYGFIKGEMEYNTDLFATATIKRMIQHWQTLLTAIVHDSQQPLQRLPLLTAHEQQQFQTWNRTERAYPLTTCLHHWIEQQAAKTPTATALIFADQKLTYAALNQRSNQLARFLQHLGVKAETLVGLCLERSIEMVIGLLSILKAGGAYVPIDPTYPISRQTFMLQDAQITILLTQSHLITQLPAPFNLTPTPLANLEHRPQVICLDRENFSAYSTTNLATPMHPLNLAYVIYTSGSTGTPKGAMNTHQGVCNRLLWMQETYPLTANDKVMQKTPFSFDVSVWEFFWPLMVGAQLVVAKPGGHQEPAYLVELIRQQQITTLHFVPSMLQLFVAESNIAHCHSLKRVICSGEALPLELQQRFFANLPHVELHNLYGPTEAAVDVSYWACQVQSPLGIVPIGKPIANIQLYILDNYFNQVPIGVPGELHIGGIGLARGYLNRSELTAEKFIPHPFFNQDCQSLRLYKTGDLARYLPDGNIEYLGRLDYQIKLRGFRIELGEIETLLSQHPAIRECVITIHGQAEEKRLIAYFVPNSAQTVEISQLRQFLQEKLPEYMVPAVFMPLDAMPLNSNGKVDRRALPEPQSVHRQSATTYVMPQTAMEQHIAQIWQQVLQLDKVGSHDNFFDLGGHSLLMIRVQTELQQLLEQTVPLMKLFQYPTVHTLAKALTSSMPSTSSYAAIPLNEGTSSATPGKIPTDIAIIGMAGRFPQAEDIDTFWQNLRDGIESVTFFTDAELLAAGVDPQLLSNPHYVKAAAILNHIEYFDAHFFDYSPRDAEIIDPQQRIFLECAWESLENAGYDVARLQEKVGIYAGVGSNTYFLNNLYSHQQLVETVGGFQLMLTNDKDFLPTRVSYKLNLTGPSINVQTACSTSLVAVHLACQGIANGECEMALAGGVTVRVPQKVGYLYQEDMILSPDGHCRAFDAKAQGTLGSSGAGIVVLKKLTAALRDHDHIYAVIKGSAVNNDGSLKVGYTAPSVAGQMQVIMQAMQNIDYESISYIETHGTATILGDPIEIEALTQAYRNHTSKNGFCALGSIKTNMGHLDAAAGIAGLMKTALALKYQLLPPSLHFEQPNPKIDFANSPFYVNTRLTPWHDATNTGKPRRAAVSSFGIGGTNAHVVLEETPALESAPQAVNKPYQLFILSAKTPTALAQTSSNLTDYLLTHSEINLTDVAYTLSVGRQAFEYRRFLLLKTDAFPLATNQQINWFERSEVQQTVNSVPIAFLFSGQGAQYVNMAQGIYQHEPVFREQLNQCLELLTPLLSLNLKAILYPTLERSTAITSQLEQTALTQPILFAVEYALAKLWLSWGIQPVAMIGHSIGEYVAACLAGVFTLTDALTLVVRRGQLMQSLPSGAMLSVPLSEAEIEPFLTSELALAAVNAPSRCVVAGTVAAIATLEQQLNSRQINGIRLHTSHAFHSAMMEPILALFTQAVSRIQLHSPQSPYLSNVTGTWITAAQATDSHYWATHLRQTVRFSQGLQTLWQQYPQAIALEIGPGRTLASLVKQHSQHSAVYTSLRHPQDECDDMAFIFKTLGSLWNHGIPINWANFYAHQSPYRIPLPTYPFERQRYWIDPPSVEMPTDIKDLQEKQADMADWFYMPLWKQVPLLQPQALTAIQTWLLFEDDYGLGVQLAEKLIQANQKVIRIKMGYGWHQHEVDEYALNPKQAQDYWQLFDTLQSQQVFPSTIIYLWNFGHLEAVPASTFHHFYSFLYLIQALAQRVTQPLQVKVISNHTQLVTGEETLIPEKVMLRAPLTILGQEHPHIRGQSIDIMSPQLTASLWAELTMPITEPVVAYRGKHRWLPTYEPLRLAAPNASQLRLRQGGIYLLTGGLGEIGLHFANYLAVTVQARLILTSRSTFPVREQWQSWLAHHDENDKISFKIRQLQTIEQHGGKIWLTAVDVADKAQMQSLVSAVEQRYGAIHGIIHAAGWVTREAFRAVEDTDKSFCEQHFRAKVVGTKVLAEIFHDKPLDFCLLMSSLSTVLGGLGFAAYAAANSFMDALAQQPHQPIPWLSINWDGWASAGESANLSIQPTAGISAWQRLVAIHAAGQVIVSTGNLLQRYQRSVVATALPPNSTIEPISSTPLHARPQVATAYLAPRDETELQLCELWQTLLGIQAIGVNDDFFQLGGDSLLATQVISRIQASFDVKISLATFFEKPTISQMAEWVVIQQLEHVKSEEMERILAELEGLK
jgi:amino acid adenylation domain-containing protein